MIDSIATTDNGQPTTDNNTRTGVVFSSGFFGFFAHAGFLAAIRELDIHPVGYSGSSSGAILAAMAASGTSDEAIKEILLNLKKSDFWDPDTWPRIIKKALGLFKGYSGYLRGDRFGRLLERLPVRNFEDCGTPLAISATNLTTKQETVFTQGDLIKAVQASGAVPILFKPVEINGELYADGGIVNKAPLKALANLVDLESIIVHYIDSDNLEAFSHAFLRKRLTPWHIHYTAFNIARKEAYLNQLEIVRTRGIRVIEVKTAAPSTGPNRLERGLSAYESAKASTLNTLRGSAILT